jgi:hypothetical protein
MNTIGTITQQLLREFGNAPMTIRTESNVLVIKSNNNETRFTNWQNTPMEEIISSTRGIVRESTSGRTLING